jgi:cation:H+ antiporter
LTLIAFGTSAPELVVSVIASLGNKGDIILSNIIGSNLANTFLILGIMGVLSPIVLHKLDIKKELYINIFAAGFLALIFINPFHFSPVLSWGAGIIFLGGFIFFIGSLFPHITSKEDTTMLLGHDPEQHSSGSAWIDALKLLSGATALAFGGNFVVSGATLSAQHLGITEALVGLFAVALGTSLPELVTSVIAARKNEPEMAVGNIVGSNIFNIFLILGISSFLRPIPLNMALLPDVLLTFMSSILLVALFIVLRAPFYKKSGVSFLLIYSLYSLFIFLRG